MEHISIHALREEGDTRAAATGSTEPISIHALREEGDTRAILTPTPGTDFYPRPPRGGRPSKAHHNTITSEFLSTPSARRATDKRGLTQRAVAISIHALREEGDRSRPWCGSGRSYFYPRPPRGGRRINPSQHEAISIISIHALREEGDSMSCFASIST